MTPDLFDFLYQSKWVPLTIFLRGFAVGFVIQWCVDRSNLSYYDRARKSFVFGVKLGVIFTTTGLLLSLSRRLGYYLLGKVEGDKGLGK